MKLLGLDITRSQKRSIDSDGNAYVYSPIPTLNYGLFDGNTRSATSLAVAYRCIRLISESVGMLPIEIKRGNVVDEKHPLNGVFNDKDALLTKYELVKMLIQSVLTHGNGYAYIQRKGANVAALRYLEPTDVTISYDKKTGKLYYKCPIVSNKAIEPCNMIHVKGYSTDGINGIAVTQSATHLLKASKLAEQNAEKMFAKGGRLDGILRMTTPANSDQKTAAKEAFVSSIADGVAVLPYSMEYQSVQQSAAAQQLEQQRRFNALCICEYFGVPPVLVGASDANSYGSVESLLAVFVQNTLQPYICALEAELNRKLLLDKEADYKIDLDENYLLRTNKTDAATYYSTMTSRGIMTVNEARRELGLQPVKGGDEIVIPYTAIADNKLAEQNEAITENE